MKAISLFAGIGGFDLALIRNGYQVVYANEWDKYAAQIYRKHFGEVDTRDIRTVTTTELPDFDLLCGGFPCQAFSVAGKRGGFNDTRGTLFFEIARILTDKRPKHFLLENVKGLLSHDSGRTFQTILGVLSSLGYLVEWQVLNSKNFGVPQNRERVFIIGHLRGECGQQVFPLTGDNGKALRELTEGQSQGSRVYDPSGISTTIASQAGGLGAKTGLYAINPSFIDLSTKEARLTDYARTIQARYAKGYSHRSAEVSGVAIPVLTPDRLVKRQNGRRFKTDGEPSFTLNTQDKHGVYDGVKIRRLTPTECERLQGFPDGWTEGISDTQRYKCLGNAVTVNVVEEIIRRLR